MENFSDPHLFPFTSLQFTWKLRKRKKKRQQWNDDKLFIFFNFHSIKNQKTENVFR